MDHARRRAARGTARVFCSISRPRTDTPSRPWAAPSAARPLSGFANSAALRRELAETNLRHKALLEETECCAASPPPRPGRSGPRAPKAGSATPMPPMRGPPKPPSVADAIDRNLELLDSDDRERHGPRAERQRGLHRAAADRGRRRAAHLRCACAQARRRKRRHRHRRQRSHRAPRGAGADGGGASPHARSAVVRRRGIRRPAAAGVLQRFLSPPVGPGPRVSRRQSRRFQRARSAARRAQTPGAAGFPRLESQAARGLSRGRAGQGYLVSARWPRGQRRHHAQSGRRRHLPVRRRHRKPRACAAL